MEFEFLEHTSDIGVLGRGKSREEALIAVSRGLTDVLVDSSHLRTLEERYFHAGGHDEAAQVVNWLNEILFFFDTEGLLLADFRIDSWTGDGIVGTARGEHFDSGRHEFRTAVKAATYHQFECGRNGESWEIRVFLDV